MNNCHRSIPGALAAAIAALCTAGPAQAVNLTLIDLGFLPGGGGQESSAAGINNAGQVVGISTSTDGSRAFIWQNGTMTSLGVMGGTPFGVAGGSRAVGINASGQVVGESSNVFGARGFVWQNGSFTDVGLLPGGVGPISPLAINANGQVVGGGYTDSSYRAFLWQGGSISDLGTLAGGTSQATAINALGTVVVNHFGAASTAATWQNGALRALGALPGGLGTQANGINASGQVVGSGSNAAGKLRAVIWNNGIASSLGILGSRSGEIAFSSAKAINDGGQVVGNASSSLGQSAFIWSSATGMVDVHTLLPPGSDVRVSGAAAINDNGQIAGQAVIAGNIHAVLLNPSGTLAWTGAGTSNGQGSFVDGRNWELGFRPSALVEVLIAPSTNTTVLGPTGDMAAGILRVGSRIAGSSPVALVLQRGRITAGGGDGQVTLEANATLSGEGTIAGYVQNNGGHIAVSHLTVTPLSGGPGNVFNEGLISGSARIDAVVGNFANTATTGVRVGSGEHMTLAGLRNAGRVEVLDGALSNSGSAINMETGSF